MYLRPFVRSNIMDTLISGAQSLAAPVYALPVDAFRILAGFVGLLYFASAYRRALDFSHPDGLIDHELSQRLFPPTRLSFFQPGVPGWVFRPLFLLACVASAMVLVGVAIKWAAAYLFVLSVSTYRWNLLVIYVDDAITHLVFFWLLLLPVGRTLTLPGWLAMGSDSLEAWTTVVVPGASVRCFLANMALVYIVAGCYKFTSPMWRNGTALHAILKMPISHMPDFWGERHRPILAIVTYVALALEPLFALMFVLPAGSVAKWLVVVAAAGFHIGIIATLKIPFANLAMLGAFPIVLSTEVMRYRHGLPDPATLGAPARWAAPDLIGAGLVISLALMILWELARSARLTNIPLWKTHMSGFSSNPMCIGLWLIGIAQSYRLFDWIDDRNYHVRYEVFSRNAEDATERQLPSVWLFPTTLRHLLLQSYLVGNVWLRLDERGSAALRSALLARHARRFARRHPDSGTVEVYATTQRVTSDNLDLRRGERSLMMRFTCDDGDAVLDYPEGAVACVES